MFTTMSSHFEKVKRELKRLELAIAEAEQYDGPKQSGAVRRASMDLTRALAEMRSGKYATERIS